MNFLVKQSLSYGGNLQYTIRYVAEMPAFSEATQDGNVVIKGGDDVQKTIQYQNNYPISGKAESYVVPMREVMNYFLFQKFFSKQGYSGLQ